MTWVLGVVGGSGVYDVPGLSDVREERMDTPWGPPSDALVFGRLGDAQLVFLPRHGRGHRVAPHEIDYRANVCALKRAGVSAIVSLSAVGSLREDIRPGDVVIVDQYVDRTWGRAGTFFEQGIVAHVAFADPVCPLLARAAAEAARATGATVHEGGTYVCMQGPQFSTRAESRLHRSWGASVIGMTALPEAKLAREAELPYATVAFATDYDAWHDTEEAVNVEQILAVLHANAARAKDLVMHLAAARPDLAGSPAAGALRHAVITAPGQIGEEARARLDWLLAPSGVLG